MHRLEIKFNEKRALVTGAGTGVGRAIARRLHQLGAHVIALDKHYSDLHQLEIACPGIEILEIDLADWYRTHQVLSSLETVHLLVNAAEEMIFNPIGDVHEGNCQPVLNINVKAVINVTQEITRKMIINEVQGSIVNISSLSSLVALRNHLVYSASKGAVDQITRVCAFELAPHGIRVNAVNPVINFTQVGDVSYPTSSVRTLARIPLRTFARVGDVADAVCFLLSEKANMINGVILPVDGGFSVRSLNLRTYHSLLS